MAGKMEGIIDYCVDNELISAATDALQAQERLSALMRDRLKDNAAAKTAVDESNALVDSLRHLKSSIEGTTFKFNPVSLNKQEVVHLKHLVVSHTPDNLQPETKTKIAEKLSQLFRGQVKSLLYACVLTCPWFACSQTEISGRAKNNVLFVVYVGSDEQFFSLATQHEKELCETIDEPPIFATEVRHFCAQLQKGNVRCIEALCSPPGGVVMCSSEWLRLSTLVDPQHLLHNVFVERCLGQAMGALVKKKPLSGRLVVRDDATLTKYCDSFRLLAYAESAIKKEPLIVWRQVGVAVGGANDDEETEIVSLLQQAFEGLVFKEQLLDYVVRFKTRVEDQKEGVAKIEPHYWNDTLGEWLAGVRMDGVKLTLSSDPAGVPHSLRQLLDDEGLTSVHTRDVIVVAKGGSHMYNLATPTSDTDYIIVYREPTNQIISSSFVFKESKDNRGQQNEIETAAYEVRLFCEMVLKGAVNMFELLYADSFEYASEHWQLLTRYKESFMSEKVILQYIGFIKTHMKLFASGKHAGTPRERKLLYQVYHKLLSLESFMENGPPLVGVTGEQRDFILRLRKGPLEGELDKHKLYSEAETRLVTLRHKLHQRTKRFSEFGNYRILQTWLLAVRGVGVKEPLKMTTPPLIP